MSKKGVIGIVIGVVIVAVLIFGVREFVSNRSVSESETIEVDPLSSSEYSTAQLAKERDALHTLLQSRYPTISTEYIIADEALSHKGEWYSAKLIQRVSGGNEPDVYRVILKKESSEWSIVVSPQLVIGIPDNPSVPKDVIRKVNEPLSTAAYNLLYSQ